MPQDLYTITFDQYQRYNIITDIINKFRVRDQKFKILEVGAGIENNLSKFLPDDDIYFLDRYGDEHSGNPKYINADITSVRIDTSYDFVVSIDTYEHISPEDRDTYLDNIIFSSTIASIIAAPFDTPDVIESEKIAAEIFKASHGYEHNWLQEHLDNGLPSLSMTLDYIANHGFVCSVLPNGYLPRWLETISFTLLYEDRPELKELMAEFNRYYNKCCYQYDNAEPSYRHVIIVEKNRSGIDFSQLQSDAAHSTDIEARLGVLKLIMSRVNESYQSYKYNSLLHNNRLMEREIERLSSESQSMKARMSSSNDRNDVLGCDGVGAERQLGELVREKAALTEQCNVLSQNLRSANERSAALEFEISSMKQSTVWRLLQKFDSLVVNHLLPNGSKRRGLYVLSIKSIRIITTEGLGSYLQHFKGYLGKRKALKTQSAMRLKKIAGLHTGDAAITIDTGTYSSYYLSPGLSYRPKISIVMPVYNTDKKWLVKAIESVRNQYYDNWELCIADDASPGPHVRELLEAYKKADSRINVIYLAENHNISGASNEALKLVTGDFVLLMDHDDELARNALYEVISLVNKHPDAEFIYSDDDKIDDAGNRFDPQFKPDWSPELLLSYCYLSHIKVFRKGLIEKAGGFRSEFDGSQDYDLALRVTELTDRIYHIPKILYHWRCLPQSTAASADAKPESIERGRLAVAEALQRRKIPGRAVIPDFAVKCRCGIYKIDFEISSPPEVSIIIPTKDKLALLRKCIDSIENKTTYPNYKIVIVDTGSREKETLDYLAGTKHRVIRYVRDRFSFAGVMNHAVSSVESEYVLLLNNDTEVISPEWIHELVGYMLADRKIAAVGAKLIYGDGRVQHAGVIIGLNGGLAGHANKLLHYQDGGYLSYNNVARDYSAVTAACMLTRRSAYEEVSGLDELKFSIAYNDVDYCLKLIDRGYRVVYNPYALLYHHEGSSRGTGAGNDDPAEERNFREKWGQFIKAGDPYYNPNLSIEDELFTAKNQANTNCRVLFVTHNLNFEGAPISLFLTAVEIARRNYDVTVLSLADGPMAQRYADAGINLIIYPDSGDFDSRFKALLLHYCFDVAYINTIATYGILPMLKEQGIPTAWIIRESEREHYFRELNGLSRGHFGMVEKVVFVANATRKIYTDLEHNGNFTTIYNGIDIDSIDEFKKLHSKAELRKKHGFSASDTIITILGTTCERKGQKFFIEAAIKVLNESKRKDLKFLVVGAREIPYLTVLREIISNSPYADQILLVPETDEAFDYYRLSDIFVCASLIESLPRVILEAMSFELPIISTNVFGIKEQIEDGTSGILIEPANSDIMARKLLYLLEHDDFCKVISKNAYGRVKSKFGLDVMGDNYESLIKHIRKNY